MGKLQNMKAKMFCSLELSLLTFFVSRQRTEESRWDDELDEVKVRVLLLDHSKKSKIDFYLIKG